MAQWLGCRTRNHKVASSSPVTAMSSFGVLKSFEKWGKVGKSGGKVGKSGEKVEKVCRHLGIGSLNHIIIEYLT